MNNKQNISIVQHNTLQWSTNKHNLLNVYKEINPDIFLLISHGLKEGENIKIPGYNTYSKNTSNEISDDSAILVKRDIKHRINDNFLTDVLDKTVETTVVPVAIATTYLPPRRPNLPYPDSHKLAYNNHPTYVLGDLSASHTSMGQARDNNVGRGLVKFFRRGKLIHLEPDFLTYHNRNTRSSPDAILANIKAMHNIIIKPGTITTSDHIPIVMIITADAITHPSPPRLNLKKKLIGTPLKHMWKKKREV